MKRFSLVAATVAIFGAALAAGAQTNGKIAWIDPGRFADEKDGITEFVTAIKLLEAEMMEKYGLESAAKKGALGCLLIR